MTAPHDPASQPSVEGLTQSLMQAFGTISDHIQQITGMTPLQLQQAMDELPDDQRAELIQRIQGSYGITQ